MPGLLMGFLVGVIVWSLATLLLFVCETCDYREAWRMLGGRMRFVADGKGWRRFR